MTRKRISKAFEPELQEYLLLKKSSTKSVYASQFRNFIKYYESKYGAGKGFGHFLDRIYDEMKKYKTRLKVGTKNELNDTEKSTVLKTPLHLIP